MRNLKKLFAVVLAVAMIASMMVPALAANTYGEEALKLQAIKVFAGGPDDLKLDEGVTRIQGLTFAIRAAGKEADALAMTDAEVDAILADWTDAATIPAWGRKYAAYAIENEITVGTSKTEKIFGAMNPISGTSFLVFLMKSGMGYAAVTTADVVDAALEAGILTAAQAATLGGKAALIRDDAAGILFGAFTTGLNADDTKLIDAYIASGATTEADAAAAGFIEVLGSMSVKAIGARKLEVKFNKAADTEKAKFEVKRGTVKPSPKSIKFAEDKKSAVIEFSTDMAEGDYTVTVTGLTDEPLVATTKVEAAKLSVIRFLSELAIRNKDGDVATTTVVAENQYGENVNSKLPGSNIKVSASKGTTATVDKEGVIKVTGTKDTFKVDESIVITIVDSDTATVATKTLKISAAAAVESIEFGVLTTDDKDLKDKEINVASMVDNADKYYLPIIVKDQYGNALTKSELQNEISAETFKLISSEEKIVSIGKETAVKIDANDDGTFIKLNKIASSDAKSGTAVITAIASGTGKTASTKIVVKENPKYDVVTISAPETELKIDVETVLPVTIVNTYGEEVSLNDAVTPGDKGKSLLFEDGQTKLDVTNATIIVSKDYVKDVTSIKIKPTAKNVVVTVLSDTAKYQSLSLVANDKPVVTSIKGLKADFATMLANDASLTTVLAKSDKKDNNIVFLDQYGEEIKTTQFEVSATDKDNDKTSLTTADGIVITSGAKAGTENYEVKLLDDKGDKLDTFEFTVTVVDKNDIKEFGVEDLNKFYTGVIVGDYDQDIEAYGLVDGKKVVINQNMVKHVSGLKGVGLFGGAAVYAQAETDTEKKDKDGTISLLIDNGKSTYTVTKAIVYSNADPKAASIVFKNDGDEVKGEVTSAKETDYATAITAVAKDQYGVEFDAIAAGSLVETNKTADSVQLNLFVDGIYKSLKVIFEK